MALFKITPLEEQTNKIHTRTHNPKLIPALSSVKLQDKNEFQVSPTSFLLCEESSNKHQDNRGGSGHSGRPGQLTNILFTGSLEKANKSI